MSIVGGFQTVYDELARHTAAFRKALAAEAARREYGGENIARAVPLFR